MLSFQFFFTGSATSQQCKNKKLEHHIGYSIFLKIGEVPTEWLVLYGRWMGELNEVGFLLWLFFIQKWQNTCTFFAYVKKANKLFFP